MKPISRATTWLSAAIFAGWCLSLITGCGGNNSMPPITAVSSAAPQSTTFTIGDAPLDGVLAFEVTVNNITLTGANGTVTVLNTPTEVELSHLAGTFEPLTLTKIPADSYSQISVSFGPSEISFLPAAGGAPIHADIPGLSAPVILALNPPVVVPQGTSTLNFDVKLAQSLTIDASNNVTFNPVFTLTAAQVGPVDQEDEDHGELEDIKGMLSSVSGTQFTITIGKSSQTLTFNTDANTKFDPAGTVLSTLLQGTVLEVDGVTQSDGSFLAKNVEVESEEPEGLETEGVVIQVSGAPPTSFQLISREASAPLTLAPNTTDPVTVNIDSNTKFRVSQDGMNLNGVSFTFQSAADLAAGQNVEADADIGNASTFSATRVQLKMQALDGTISGLSGNQFQLTLDPNSTFAKLTGVTAVNVFSVNSENKTGAALANGQNVRVRGLLFFTAASGTAPSSYNFVARRIQNQ